MSSALLFEQQAVALPLTEQEMSSPPNLAHPTVLNMDDVNMTVLDVDDIIATTKRPSFFSPIISFFSSLPPTRTRCNQKTR